jgi:hypothetical protein
LRSRQGDHWFGVERHEDRAECRADTRPAIIECLNIRSTILSEEARRVSQPPHRRASRGRSPWGFHPQTPGHLLL